MIEDIPASWQKVLDQELQKDYFNELQDYVRGERETHHVFPPKEETFTALELTPYEHVNVLILGQDPYHDDGQAHGLAFSVRGGVKIPPSLRNIYKELESDLGIPAADHGNLEPWAKQGVLLLNTVLTVRAHEANSHKKRGWEIFTDAIIEKLNQKTDPVIFVLWGNPSQRKRALIDEEKHVVIASAHPSPLSASRGFLGSKPFSQINSTLKAYGKSEIDWNLDNSQMSFRFS